MWNRSAFRLVCVCVIALVVLWAGRAAAAEDTSNVSDAVRSMTTELALSPAQAAAVRPILKEYLVARQQVMESAESQPIIDRKALRAAIKQLKQKQREQLSKVLDEPQMAKWVSRENLRSRMNSGVSGFQSSDGTAISSSGANFNF